MSSDLVLRIAKMRKELRSAGSAFVLEVPDLHLEKGRFYGLVGRSGSGKSTMLDLLAMVSRPSDISAYELYVGANAIDLAAMVASDDDKQISHVRINHFGYILQSGGLFPFLTVRENLRLPFMLSGRGVDDTAIVEMAETFGMVEQLDKKPSGLSGGQRQRVSILRALCLKPDIVLADEPTASVDENLADIIVGELKRLASYNDVTVIMVSHDLELVHSFADHVMTLKPEVIDKETTRTVVEPAHVGAVS